MTKQQAQARINALQKQVDDADAAETAATAAVQAAKAAQAATKLVAGHVFGAIAGAVPVPATTPAASTSVTTPTPAATTPVPQQAVPTPATPAAIPPIVQQTPVVQTVVHPAVAAPAAAPAAQSANPRHRSWMQWVCAFIGALVALVISLNTRDWFAGLADVNGTPNWLFRAGWIVAVTAAGFFGGGLIGSLIDERRVNNNTP